MKTMKGIGASPGVAVGPVVRVETVDLVIPDVDDPKGALAAAVEQATERLRGLSDTARANGREEAAEVLHAQSLMAEDPMLVDQVEEHLDDGLSLDAALSTASQELEAMLSSLDDEYLAARAADIGEVAHVVRQCLAGHDGDAISMTEPSILIAVELTAAETAGLDPDQVLGFITETGGATSHVAIIARSLGVPAIVGASDLMTTTADSTRFALDGSTGEFIADPDADTTADYEARAVARAEQRSRLGAFQGKSVSFDGTTISISANIGSLDDVAKAVEASPDGVGLFRSEFLFLDRADAPTEDEQYETYRTAVEAFSDTVVLRTFDIGGDKPAEFLDLEEEENPFLGVRGVRLYEQFDELFASQMRAALRASAHGDLAIMLPMVATRSEFTRTRDRIEELRAELVADGVEVGSPQLGVMVEVPSVALHARSLAADVDFFSIGTNDLTQYTCAADRGNPALNDLSDAMHPAVLELCAMTVAAANEHGKQVSVCGLAAADPVSAAVFAALGVTKLSVGANSVNLIRATISELEPSFAELVERTRRDASDAAELRAALSGGVATAG